MISDTLFEAIEELDCYLYDPDWEGVYTEPLRARIVACRNEMKAIQDILDTPPTVGRALEDADAANPQGGAAQ